MQSPFDPGYYGSEELRRFGFKAVGENVLIARNCTIICPENISIGDNSRIDGFCNIIANGPLTIGRYVHIHSYCQIGARGGVVLEDYSALATGCLVYSASDDVSGKFMVGGCVPSRCTRPKVAPVRMGHHSVALSHTVILPGVTFGEGAASCAQSVVQQDVPDWTVVAGVPAEHRRFRSKQLLQLEALVAEVAQAA